MKTLGLIDRINQKHGQEVDKLQSEIHRLQAKVIELEKKLKLAELDSKSYGSALARRSR